MDFNILSVAQEREREEKREGERGREREREGERKGERERSVISECTDANIMRGYAYK